MIKFVQKFTLSVLAICVFMCNLTNVYAMESISESEVSEYDHTDSLDSYLAGNREKLVDKMSEKSSEGDASVSIDMLSTAGYRYRFSCSENSFSVGYTEKDSSWTKVISLSYDYEKDLVTLNFQQTKSGYFYAATASISASDYIDGKNIDYKDATGSDYSGMCVSYAKTFSNAAIPDINSKMMSLFDVSLYQIGFISYAHSHTGGNATCISCAVCKICDEEYGELKEHTIVLTNEKKETCDEEGYTGDYVCEVCGQMIEEGSLIPVKERVEATGKFALLKSFLKQEGLLDSEVNHYFQFVNDESQSSRDVATISYLADMAQFKFCYENTDKNGTVTITMSMEENGSQVAIVDFDYDVVALKARATFNAANYTSEEAVCFEKTSANILENSQIQDLCNSQLRVAFIEWDLLLLDKLGLDVNMADLGFTSYEDPGTHTWNLDEVINEATCENEGIERYICSTCGEIKTETVLAKGHQWNTEYTVDKEATATESGLESIHCRNCDAIKDVREIPKQNLNTNTKKYQIKNAVITLSKTSYFYDGKEKKPTVKSVKLGGVTLKSGDYKVSYKNNKNIGTAAVVITGTGNYTGTVTKAFTISVKKGTVFVVNSYKYRITDTSSVAFAGLKNSAMKKVTIPKTVKIGGKSFKITSIAAKALYKKTKVTSVTIGSNVKVIGESAFYGCKKLGTIIIKSANLKSVGKNAVKGIKSTAKIKVPKKKLGSYKKLFQNKGQSSVGFTL